MNQVVPEQSYSVRESAELLHCSVSTIFRMLKSGELQSFLVGSRVRRIKGGEIIRLQSWQEVLIPSSNA